jgi:hypothetical protein
MPENSGIGQLPAPNMQGIARGAAGGIVAFAKGGVNDALEAVNQSMPDPRVSMEGFNRFNGSMTDYLNTRQKAINAVKSNFEQPNPDVMNAYESVYGRRPAGAAPEVPAKPAPAVVPVVPRIEKAPSAPPEKVVAAPKEKTGIDQLRAPSAAPAPTVQASSAPATASPNYNDMYANARQAQGNPRDNLPPEIAEIGDLARAQRDKAMALADKQSEGLNALVSQRQARQDAREQNIAQQESMNPWMAMITGGLGIAQSKGKGLSGLAEGSQLGINQYMTEAKYTNAQRQKLEDARDSLQDLKYNAETMTNKDRLAAENSLTQGLMAVKDATVKHIQHREDVNERTAGHIFDAGVQQGLETQREGSQERLHASDNAQRLAIARMEIGAANARAQLLPGEARTLMVLGKGDLQKGLEMKATIEAGKFNPLTAYTSHYLPGFAGKETLTPPMTYPQFLATLGMSGTGSGSTMANTGWGQAVKH